MTLLTMYGLALHAFEIALQTTALDATTRRLMRTAARKMKARHDDRAQKSAAAAERKRLLSNEVIRATPLNEMTFEQKAHLQRELVHSFAIYPVIPQTAPTVVMLRRYINGPHSSLHSDLVARLAVTATGAAIWEAAKAASSSPQPPASSIQP